MDKKSITIQVSPEAATRWKSTSSEERQRIRNLVEFSLRDREKATQDLEHILDDIARYARERGFTEDMLDDLLDEE
ncbi:MAG TPA: hypothetical protein VFG50_13385 [Rhodothermales bacterium]|nr:hypothetical protein [Rhodothermales bacterium]